MPPPSGSEGKGPQYDAVTRIGILEQQYQNGEIPDSQYFHDVLFATVEVASERFRRAGSDLDPMQPLRELEAQGETTVSKNGDELDQDLISVLKSGVNPVLDRGTGDIQRYWTGVWTDVRATVHDERLLSAINDHQNIVAIRLCLKDVIDQVDAITPASFARVNGRLIPQEQRQSLLNEYVHSIIQGPEREGSYRPGFTALVNQLPTLGRSRNETIAGIFPNPQDAQVARSVIGGITALRTGKSENNTPLSEIRRPVLEALELLDIEEMQGAFLELAQTHPHVPTPEAYESLGLGTEEEMAAQLQNRREAEAAQAAAEREASLTPVQRATRLYDETIREYTDARALYEETLDGKYVLLEDGSLLEIQHLEGGAKQNPKRGFDMKVWTWKRNPEGNISHIRYMLRSLAIMLESGQARIADADGNPVETEAPESE